MESEWEMVAGRWKARRRQVAEDEAGQTREKRSGRGSIAQSLDSGVLGAIDPGPCSAWRNIAAGKAGSVQRGVASGQATSWHPSRRTTNSVLVALAKPRCQLSSMRAVAVPPGGLQ